MTGDSIVQRALWCVIAALCFLASCGGAGSGEWTSALPGGEHLKAVETVRGNEYAYSSGSSVCTTRPGLLYQYASFPDSSNSHFFSAEQEMQSSTKSITGGARQSEQLHPPV
jgi:hypothetical protein